MRLSSVMIHLACAGLVAGALSASPSGAQQAPAGGAQAAAPAPVQRPRLPWEARPAGAPALVPVDLNREGNFRIAPPYVEDSAFVERPDVPKGRVIRFTMSSVGSRYYPTAPPAANAADQTPQPFERQVAVYVPAGYVPNTPAPFIVVQDERWYVEEDSPMGRTDLSYIPRMLDNLIHEKRVPPMVAVMLAPGPGRQRTIEYDVVSDRYTMFVENEVLPTITRAYQIAFTRNPECRATFGESSGAAAAFTMAWFHPELYRKVISYSGTFVALQRDPQMAPNGAWDYHQTFIPQSERKPLRIWLHVSENDNGSTTPAEGMRNWVIANNRMADVLAAKGYPYQYVFSEGVGHVSRPVQRQTMPEAFEWTWRGCDVR